MVATAPSAAVSVTVSGLGADDDLAVPGGEPLDPAGQAFG